VNINMLRDSDNDAGFYAAVCAADPTSTSWTGAAVYVSVDAGASYALAFNITTETTLGVTQTALPNFTGGNILDEVSSVTVALTHGTLSSTTLLSVLAGANACVIGDEILCFRDATLNTNGTYTLRGLLRGRRGSEYAMGSHVSGERFVLVDLTKMVRVAQNTSDIGIAKKYMAISSGMSMSSGIAKDFTNLGTGLKPYSPVQLGGGRNTAGDVILTWVRRNRISSEWRDGVDVPNSEASESYEVDILNGSTVVRTLTSTSPTVTYTVAQQTTDFGGAQTTVHFNVYQLSALVGRGHGANGSV
jgi:hypothetical protein